MNSTEHHNQQSHDEPADADWEEWDGNSPFWMHCVAGSFAGVVEHTAVYPLDTVRTHIQVCASCVQRNNVFNKNFDAGRTLRGASPLNQMANNKIPMGMWQTMRFLMNEPTIAAAEAAVGTAATSTAATTKVVAPSVQGMSRLWRGVEAILIGCIPAHALYFSSYELVKAATRDSQTGEVTGWGSLLAGAAAVFGHDSIMTPLDTVKQRMQIGHYKEGVSHAVSSIIRQEGLQALYRSFPITLISNVPYGMIMVSTHEFCKKAWESPEIPAWQTVMAASSVGGFAAAALTTPLDRIKTSLQTQELTPTCLRPIPKESCKRMSQVRYKTFMEAAVGIAKEEGLAGFWRGVCPRVLSHTPAVAISWTTYEVTKNALLRHYNNGM
uniref:Mitochondrial carrier protein n=1 Tax=Amphora coffeiformis TaxID=265554 RepID=A0A7S3P9D3_9STRA|mmetsp:Transcript_2437/g.5176  ORF Transcript_2437/g.5176 Transcript_2437/m.5176 type:complete len:382 (-) Transcript_2437:107-1252(-)|eukprot:scaffold7221_cov165-Amphora_coffeaeformis.AAC.12